MKINFNATTFPTTHLTKEGSFHPAVYQQGGRVYYWPNIRCETEKEAHQRATAALKDAEDAANAVVEAWNVVRA